MRGEITYKNGLRSFRIDGRDVSQEEYDAAFPSKLEEMLASGITPFLKTDSVFLSRFGANGGQFEKTPQHGDFYRQQAERGGQSTKGKVYLSALAREPGDPEAWVDGRGDIQRVLEARGWGAEGEVRAKPRDSEPGPSVAVAEDIVQDEIRHTLANHPEPVKVDRQELRAKIINKRKHPSKK